LRVACAQDAAPSVIIDVGDCVSLKSPGERLDCYERHVEAAKRAAASPAPAPQASAAPATSHTEAVSTAPGSAAATTSSAQASAAPPAAAVPAAAATVAAAAPSPPTAPAVTSVSTPTVAAASAPSAPAPGAVQNAPADNAALNKQSQHDAQAAPAEIVATVAELHEIVPNAWLITLDNGQVWRQNIAQRFALKPGQHVTLRGTKWGASYRLSADTLNGFIQVERVR
jgi:hypothetical protein